MRTRRNRFFLDVAPVIGGNNQNRHIIPHMIANLARRLHAVHIRHLPVDQHNLIIVVLQIAFFHHRNRRHSIQRILRLNTDLF